MMHTVYKVSIPQLDKCMFKNNYTLEIVILVINLYEELNMELMKIIAK